MILSEEDIDTVEKMLAATNKLMRLLECPHSHALNIDHQDYADMVVGLNALKSGCEITLKIQAEKRLASLNK